MPSADHKRHGTEVLSLKDRELLAQPLVLPFSGKTVKNRFCKAALSESLARSDGHIDIDHLNALENVYGQWAAGGSGLILTGNVMVDRTMREMEFNVAVEDTSDLGRLTSWANTVHNHGALLVAQVSHPGRQSHGHLTKHPVAPSVVPVKQFHPLMMFNTPRELTVAEIKEIVQRFVNTSVVLHRAGFDGVELHAAHGYLISQFLNPAVNLRTDEYGGSLENRARFLKEIVTDIKKAVPKEFSIGVKLNSVDFGRRRQEGNSSSANIQEEDDKYLEEAVQVSVMLEKLEVDYIEVSGGSYEGFSAGIMDGKFNKGDKKQQPSERTRRREAHFAVFAERISSALTTTKVILTGGFVTATAMADSLKDVPSDDDKKNYGGVGKPHIDMIGLGRPVCYEPDLPNLIMSGSVTGAVYPPSISTGFIDDAVLCGGNILRMSRGKKPKFSIVGVALSGEHATYLCGYGKGAVYKAGRTLTPWK